MEKAEKIMAVFVAGTMAKHRYDPRSSPLLSTYRRGGAVFLGESDQQSRRYHEVAINYEGEIVHRPLPAGNQTLRMLARVGAREISDADFNTIRIHLGGLDIMGFQSTMLRLSPGGAMSLIGEALMRAGLPALCVAPVEERLAHYNREFFENKYRAVMCGLLKSQRGDFYPMNTGFHKDKPMMSVMGAPGWTFFEDETEAMMLRLTLDDPRIRYFSI